MTDSRRLDLALHALGQGLVTHEQLLEAWASRLSPERCAELEMRLGRAAPPAAPSVGPRDARKALDVLADNEDDADDEPDGRYARLGVHARGGMGRVWRARDGRMGRQVALKELQARFDDQPALRARFLAEARITGQLEHPGVVPVYEVVEPEDEPPYYTMRLVLGRTLSEAARDFHAGPGGPSDGPALRDLLQAFVSVCHTLAYAHSRGVIHRDVKGSNVVLGPFGEVVVLDWGLAKVMGAPAPADGDEAAIAPWPDGEAEPTEQGRLGGTPEYMSPEQARGEAEKVDPRTDVFGLGAVLYQILTGQAPYVAPTRQESVRLARECQARPPRELWRGVPRPLEALCLKALAKEPGGRYPTATALAGEVKQWLADEAVKSYREPLAARAGRWARRHRSLMTGAVVLLTAGVVGLAGGLWAVGREQARTAAQRDEARDNLEQAIKAVDLCFGLAKDDKLLQADNMRKVRQVLLEKTLPFYESFSEKTARDPDVQARHAEYLFRAAFITQDIGSIPEAVALYEKAAAIQEQVCAAQPEDARQQTALARTRNSLAILQRQMGQLPEALASYEQARDIQQRLSDANPEVPQYRADLAVAWNNLAVLYKKSGDMRQAMASMERARDLRLTLIQAHPEVPRYQADLAQTWLNLAAMLYENGHLSEAIPCGERARDVWRRLSEANPQVGRYRAYQALAWSNLGVLQSIAGDRGESLKSYRQASQLQRALAREQPDVTDFRSGLAATLINLGLLQAEGGKPADARGSYEEAVALLRELGAAHPRVKEHRSNLAQVLNNLGPVLSGAGQPDAARRNYAEARQHWGKLHEEHPNVPAYPAGMATTWINEGNLDAIGGGHAAALVAGDQAVKLLTLARQAEPRNPVFRHDLISAHWLRATALGKLGRPREALTDWDAAVRLNGKPDDDARLRRARARALVECGDYSRAMGEVESLASGDLSAQLMYDLAGIATLSAAATWRDGARPLPMRHKQADGWARQAVALLTRAGSAGHFADADRRRMLERDGDLAFLREREDFRTFVESLP